MRKSFRSIWALALLLVLGLGSRAALADQDKTEQKRETVAVLAINSYDELLANVGFIGELANKPDLVKNFEQTLKLVTQEKGLQGLDTKKPAGAVVMTDGSEFIYLGFVPVTDLNALLDTFASRLGALEEVKDLAGVKQLTLPTGRQIYFKAADGYGYISDSAANLKELPKNPLSQLEGLDGKYDIALRAYIHRVPEAYRQLVIAPLQQAFEAGSIRREGEKDDAYEARKKLGDQQMQQVVQMINELDQVTVGWKVDRSKKKVLLDFTTTAVAGTKTAKQLSEIKSRKSDYAGFRLPGAALTIASGGVVPAENAGQTAAMLEAMKSNADSLIDKDEGLSEAQSKKESKEIVADAVKIFVDTIKSGKLDVAGSVVLEPNSLKVAAGAYVASGNDVNDLLKKLVELAKKEPQFPGVKFDVEKYKDVRFHSMSIPVTDEHAKSALGDTLDVYLGVAASSVYLGVGSGSLDLVKKGIDLSASTKSDELPPSQIVASLTPILKFGASLKDAGDRPAELAKAVGKSGEQDRMTLTLKPESNGATYHIEIDEGVLRLLSGLGS